MIDAYEIGIQLILQEDVSAGLAVINRGLAEVDRAIAATSADLAGLVREAQTATKAVAVATSGRTVPDALAERRATGGAEVSVEAGLRQQPPATPVATSGEGPAPSQARATPPTAPNGRTTSQPSNQSVGSEPAPREQAVSSSAPVRSALVEAAWSGPRATTTQSQSASTVVDAPAQGRPAAPNSSPTATPLSRGIAAATQEPRRNSTSRAPQVAVTSSVSREQRSTTSGLQPGRAPHNPISGPATRRERPAAPWSGVDHSGQQGQMTRSYEKAAAPQSSGRSQNEAGGGTVMLDGRLVGQWLSEHMGREASRPPTGTSFFDPRQTPAWNVSGAM